MLFLLLLPLLGCSNPVPATRGCAVPVARAETVTTDSFVDIDFPTDREVQLTDAFDREVARGLPSFVKRCRTHDLIFREVESLTGVSRYWLAGIAAHESKGCTPRRNRAGFMHVMQPGQRHLAQAQRLLGVTRLDWQGNTFHEAVLGGVMLRDYVERRGSLSGGLRAYHVGEEGNLNGKRAARYEEIVTIAAVMTARSWANKPYEAREGPIREEHVPNLFVIPHVSLR